MPPCHLLESRAEGSPPSLASSCSPQSWATEFFPLSVHLLAPLVWFLPRCGLVACPAEPVLWAWVGGIALPIPCVWPHHQVHGRPPISLAADLGHSWPGTIPHHHPELLPQCQRGHPRLRHHKEELLSVSASLDRGCEEVRRL